MAADQFEEFGDEHCRQVRIVTTQKVFQVLRDDQILVAQKRVDRKQTEDLELLELVRPLEYCFLEKLKINEWVVCAGLEVLD